MTCATVSSSRRPNTTAEPVLFEGELACQGPSKSGSCVVAKTRISSWYATKKRVPWRAPASKVYGLRHHVKLRNARTSSHHARTSEQCHVDHDRRGPQGDRAGPPGRAGAGDQPRAPRGRRGGAGRWRGARAARGRRDAERDRPVREVSGRGD